MTLYPVAVCFRSVFCSSEASASDEDSTWISWFVSLRGNEYFCEVDEDYIQVRTATTHPFVKLEVHLTHTAVLSVRRPLAFNTCSLPEREHSDMMCI